MVAVVAVGLHLVALEELDGVDRTVDFNSVREHQGLLAHDRFVGGATILTVLCFVVAATCLVRWAAALSGRRRASLAALLGWSATVVAYATIWALTRDQAWGSHDTLNETYDADTLDAIVLGSGVLVALLGVGVVRRSRHG